MGELVRRIGDSIIQVVTSSGVVSGIVSSVILYFVMFQIRPRIKVSENICWDIHDERFRIKVVNLTHANLTDVKYALYVCYRSGDGNIDTKEIASEKPKLELIQALSRKRKQNNFDFAIRISYNLADYMTPEYTSYLFTFYAKHAVTGSATFIRKEFSKNDIVCGQFGIGESTTVQQPLCHNTYQNCNGTCALR